jgi:hypothetical protein
VDWQVVTKLNVSTRCVRKQMRRAT